MYHPVDNRNSVNRDVVRVAVCCAEATSPDQQEYNTVRTVVAVLMVVLSALAVFYIG